MKDEYNKIYEQLFDSYEESDLFYKINPDYSRIFQNIYYEFKDYNLRRQIFSERIKRNIMDFEYQNRFPLRSDAKFFLVSTFDNMIVKPILQNYLEKNSLVTNNYFDFESRLFEIIDSDIKLILNNSLTKRKGEEKISGHQIIRSVDNLWGEMRSSKIEIWG
ncbi:hypothetical protein CMT69_07885 [Elizabethkingia anophelis]|uniref:hypothetical protein n=1 Tax=Elizabethkingia anophelis TaxID=1117645 RepID=UPI000DDA355D|nr:hypothetical protein [Elizabethkingia anophelis]MCT3641371.1 hypothetical protein [Elizabethkingia anophelis]MDV3944846.1 hypothetical protein [Elizabethkingia anophelis]RBA44003.1 hypothetical protein DSC46_14605 [Elizabethkingia anophelis]